VTEKARLWLDEHAGTRVPVFLASEIPDDVLPTLRRRGLVIHVPGGVVVLRSPGDAPADVIRSLVWPITEAITRAYAPAVVERDSAVRLYLGRTDPGPEIRIRQTGQTRWRKEIAPGVVIRAERGDVSGSQILHVGESAIPVDVPEEVLLSLPLQFLRDGGLVDVAIWMKSLVLSRPVLTDAYRRKPRPVVLKRMEHIARDVENERLADLLSVVVREEQNVRIGRDRTGIGRQLVVPPLVATSGTTRQPWLDRLRVLIRESREQVREALADFEAPTPSADLDKLLAGARASKAYDAYHSSSIEGYRLRLDEVSALLGGGRADGPDIEDIRSKLAVVGYSTAFDALLLRIGADRGATRLTGNLALDLYADLFTPSVEAGIVTAEALRGWRRSPVFIRDTLFVPPRWEKVGPMIDLLFEEISAIDVSEGLLRAVLVHLWFVWIHPFPDGNGRVARFLMNAAMLGGGLPWLTIRVDQREEYFAALERSQLEEGHASFARFIAGSCKVRE
jgi:Fic family protein